MGRPYMPINWGGARGVNCHHRTRVGCRAQPHPLWSTASVNHKWMHRIIAQEVGHPMTTEHGQRLHQRCESAGTVRRQTSEHQRHGKFL